MQNENILMQMVKDNMLLTVVDPTDYSEVECHVEGGPGDFHLVSEDAMAPEDGEGESQGFILPIRKLVTHGSSEFFILCDGVDDYFEVIDIN